MVKDLLIILLVLVNLVLPFSIWQKLNEKIDVVDETPSEIERTRFDLETCQKELLQVIEDCKP